jgi:SAM-dependent MidA family methyltransferase
MMPDDDLPAPSSFMSSRWSRDNLVTCHPAQLYNGRVLEHIDEDGLEHAIRDLEKQRGPVHVGAGRMGVFTWDISCFDGDGPFVLQVPLVLDERGARGRARRDVPRLNVENARAFIARGLTRFVVEPRDLLTLAGDVPAAIFAALPDHRPIAFGRGALQVELAEGKHSWLVSLGAAATAELLAEMVAALVYHYEPGAGGGTAIADVCVNDGDFAARRRADGGFDVRLTAARRRESGVGPNLLLLYLIQMMAYEDWNVDGNLVGLPTLAGNPSVAFEGVARGLRYRHADLGGSETAAVEEARRWVRDFGRSREGRAYRPWADRFAEGRLPPAFGADPRERWWRLVPLRTKLGLLELRARHEPASDVGSSARALAPFLDRLAREIGRLPADPGAARLNDLGRHGLVKLLAEAQVPPDARDGVAGELLARWPWRSLDHVLAEVPGARGLRRMKSRLSFGDVVADADQATLASLGPAPPQAGPARPIANPETFGSLVFPAPLHEAAVRTFPTFEVYMDSALHDPDWGYYARRVSIGRGGHFITNPESLSPRYGEWIAAWAVRFWHEMLAHGDLSEADPFPIIEFGAGNGRLARDIMDAVARNGDERWRAFAARVAYRIYERSPSLRQRQRALLGPDAAAAEGDARHPAETLRRDFPGRVRGLVLSNEVPDAFGVHKVVLAADGRARATLVMPRVEAKAGAALDRSLAGRIEAADASVRRTFELRGNPGDRYLDGETYAQVMSALAAEDAERREGLLAALWFEEALVPAAAVPELAAHLRANAAQYATALAAEDSGVVVYVNVHAGRFIRELGSSLAAGFVVTVDYGDSTWGLVHGARRGEFPFRVYGHQEDFVPRPNDPYALPGSQDMTADVNFTDLAQAGEDAGLRVVHFGPERDLVGADLPALLAEAAEAEAVAEFLGNPVFKVLVLGTRPSDVFAGPLASPLRLSCSARDVAKSRREKIENIARSLR